MLTPSRPQLQKQKYWKEGVLLLQLLHKAVKESATLCEADEVRSRIVIPWRGVETLREVQGGVG
jgi:hypothetical protein